MSAAAFRNGPQNRCREFSFDPHLRHFVCEHANMEAMREAWSDDRLDDLNRKVDDGFLSVDKRFDAVDKRFDWVDKRFDAIDRRFERLEDKVDARFDSLQRTLILFCGGIIAALLGMVATFALFAIQA
ncbi:MAG TPA: hypothetical protein VKC63_11610 [Solirubrobacterales bacterium]|nr:hypothetical protein [Solirubrobacterales bacterium]